MQPTTPGTYTYSDPIGSGPQLLEVVDDAGELCARFPDDEEDGFALVPVADMAGTWS